MGVPRDILACTRVLTRFSSAHLPWRTVRLVDKGEIGTDSAAVTVAATRLSVKDVIPINAWYARVKLWIEFDTVEERKIFASKLLAGWMASTIEKVEAGPMSNLCQTNEGGLPVVKSSQPAESGDKAA